MSQAIATIHSANKGVFSSHEIVPVGVAGATDEQVALGGLGAALEAASADTRASHLALAKIRGNLAGRNLSRDEKLVTHFDDLVGALEFSDFAVPSGDRPIAHEDKFSFVPVVSTERKRKSWNNAGYSVRIEPKVRTSYGGDGGKPYLDAGQAIGLVYDGSLIAVAAAGIENEDPLTVVQIQDVTGVRKHNGKAFYKTGLHNGILWRDTLVRAWEALGEALGEDTIAVQSNRNNRWSPVQYANGRGYDDVAERMGFTRASEMSNWVRPIEKRLPALKTEGRLRKLARRLLVVF